MMGALAPDEVVSLSERHARWIAIAARDQSPPISKAMMLARLLDEAISREQARERRRADQLEVYRASGYPEHHPDYPDFP
jgi:hypothetical protein